MNFEEMVQKAVNTKAKVGLRSSTMVRDSDICCSRNQHLSNSTASKVQTQETTAKDFYRPKKPKTKETKYVYANVAEPSESAKKKDKQKRLKRRQKCTREQKKTPATDNNAINAFKKDSRKKHDASKVTCLNCNKEGYYASDYTKPPKN